MTTIQPFEIVGAQNEPLVYIARTGFIPNRLLKRVQYETVSEEKGIEYVKMANGRELTQANILELTGNDTVVIQPYPAMPVWQLLTFKKVVKLATSMGQGQLRWNGELMNDSPVVDFDYQDSSFEADMKNISNFMLAHNK